MGRGCDYSWSRPNLGTLRQAGMEFVIRYVSHDTTGKNLTAGEANAIRANGMDIVTNWEFAPHAPLNGRAQGIADAANGINMAVALGQPSHAAIYFSVDFDAQDSDMHAIAAYIDGAVATIGYDRVGVYGGYRVIANMAATNRCKYFWQTYAWSNGNWHHAAQLIQTQNDVNIGGGQIDVDQSLQSDIGSWGGVSNTPPPSTVNGGNWDLGTPFRAVGDWLNLAAGQMRSVSGTLDNL